MSQQIQNPASPLAPVRKKSSVVASTGIVSLLTLVSRIFGLARDSILALTLGTNLGADAFAVAFRIPNIFRRMFAEGNLTLSFVPVFSESLKSSQQQAKKLVNTTFTFLSLVLILLTLFGVIAASWWVFMAAPGFVQNPEKFALTRLLTQITFPYIFLVSLGALAMGILNSKKHFAAPAASPIFLNIGIILGAVFFSRFFSEPSIGVAWGVLLGGVFQLMIQIPSVMKYGFFPKIDFDFKDPQAKKVFKLMLPAMYGSAAYQVNLLSIYFLASFLREGAVSSLNYAGRVIEFPLGIFAISIATVLLPRFSDHAAQKRTEKLTSSLMQALNAVWWLNVPAMVAMVVLSKPITALLFFRGQFDLDSLKLTEQALTYYALGLPFVSGSRILTNAFYAMQDSKKPVIATNISVVVNILVGVALMFWIEHRGLALAVSIGAAVNFFYLLKYYREKAGALGLKKALRELTKVMLAAMVMGAALIVVQHYWDWSLARFWTRLAYVLSLIGIGLVIYLMLTFVLKAEFSQKISQFLLRRLKKSSAAN
ncbi:MAG: murein biosynthesis integral membrane protein MurJ [Deltaproteobacteria bacterium]|nr:murein biosynthesis integral membrane protein MurJ [Deltaproteobacteria bacterium]